MKSEMLTGTARDPQRRRLTATLERWLDRPAARVALVLLGVCIMVMKASDILWRAGWDHYKRGGGVFLGSPVITSELEAAAKYFRWAGRIKPWKADAHNYEGHALMRLGRLTEALACYDATLRFRPNNLPARYGKAKAYMKLGKGEEMVSALKHAFSIAPDLDRQVRFSEDFAHLRDDPIMREFRSRFRLPD